MPAGRPKNIDSPKQLGELFEQYSKWCKENPIKKHDFVGKDAIEVYRELERPLTFAGFECYLFDLGIINDLGDYEKNKEGRYTEFTPIITRIKKYIDCDQFTGATVGIYNHNIIARKLGLIDKTQNANLNADVSKEEAISGIIIQPKGGEASQLPTNENDVDLSRDRQ